MKQQDRPRVEKPIRSLQEALDYCRTLEMRISQQRQMILELFWRSQGQSNFSQGSAW